MNKTEVKIKRLHIDAKIPLYATEEAAGFDFYSIDNHTLNPGEVIKIPIGISFEIPKGFFVQIVSRSGLSLKGIHHLPGTLDSDYRGELHLLLLNTTKQQFKIEKGDRIAQGILLPVFTAEFKEVNDLSQTKRGSGGFNSTGIK